MSDTDREAILRRRARFVLLTLVSAGLGAGLSDCSGDGSTSPHVCLSVGGMPIDAQSDITDGSGGEPG